MAAMRVSGWLFSSTLMLSAPKALRNRVPPAEVLADLDPARNEFVQECTTTIIG